jgi:hypothetical protein
MRSLIAPGIWIPVVRMPAAECLPLGVAGAHSDSPHSCPADTVLRGAGTNQPAGENSTEKQDWRRAQSKLHRAGFRPEASARPARYEPRAASGAGYEND